MKTDGIASVQESDGGSNYQVDSVEIRVSLIYKMGRGKEEIKFLVFKYIHGVNYSLLLLNVSLFHLWMLPQYQILKKRPPSKFPSLTRARASCFCWLSKPLDLLQRHKYLKMRCFSLSCKFTTKVGPSNRYKASQFQRGRQDRSSRNIILLTLLIFYKHCLT